jgi:hypothetical protein
MFFRFYNMYRLFRPVFLSRWCMLERNYNQQPSKYTPPLLSQEMVHVIQHTKQGTVLWCIHLVKHMPMNLSYQSTWLYTAHYSEWGYHLQQLCKFLNGEMKNYLVLKLWVCHAEPALGKQRVPGNHEKSWVTGNFAPHVYRVLHRYTTPSILSSKLMAW